MMSQENLFTIRQMIDLTGLSEFTIRGWENRYEVFKPRRTATGRRRYSKKDIEQALILRELIKRGHKIGQLSELTIKQRQNLFTVNNDTATETLSPKADKEIQDVFSLLALQNWHELELTIKKTKFKKPLTLVHDFLIPLLHLLSRGVDEGTVSIAQEHILSSLIKEKIYSTLNELKVKKNNPSRRFVLATPEGDFHETGLLLAHLIIRSLGYSSLYLGPHTPVSTLLPTALRFNATDLLIVSTLPKKVGAKQDLLTYISHLQKIKRKNLQILVAGSQVPSSPELDSSTLILKDFIELETELKNIKH